MEEAVSSWAVPAGDDAEKANGDAIAPLELPLPYGGARGEELFGAHTLLYAPVTDTLHKYRFDPPPSKDAKLVAF